MSFARSSAVALVALCVGPAVGACTGSAGRPEPASAPAAPAPPLTDAATWETWRHAEEIVLTPHRLADAIAPLVRHRQVQGHVTAELEIEPILQRASSNAGDPAALQAAIRELSAHAPSLRFVLLVGDFDELPTFFLPKLSYEHHSPFEHQNPHAITQDEHRTYPSDDPYGRGAGAKLAVGRVPARTPEEVEAFVHKVVGYETAPLDRGDQTWRRRVTLYTGDPRLGPMGDSLVQTIAAGILDREMSYDYDLRLAFAKDDSPYAYGFDAGQRRFVEDLDDGAIVAAYVGHGSVTRFAPADFRGRRFEVGTADDAAALRIAAGKPIFFSIACDTGAFDRPGGLPSLAERMILNPDGPVAVFASSRESHPYPNALYARAIIEHFVNERPATVGAGILAVKDGMVRGSIPVAELLLGDDLDALKKEHVSLYNLFGDPATKLRYAGPLTIATDARGAAEGAAFDVDVSAPGVLEGRVRVTIETRRAAMKPAPVSADGLAQMSETDAFAAMTRNNAVANDKVVSSVDAELHAGKAHLTLRAPSLAGDYVVKAFASGADAAAGHVELRVGPRGG